MTAIVTFMEQIKSSARKLTKKQLYGLGGLGCVLLIVFGVLIFMPRKRAEVGYVSRGRATYSVYGKINVEPIKQLIMKARISGEIKELNVSEGDVVEKGQVLVVINNESLKAQLSKDKSTYDATKKKLEIGPENAINFKQKKKELEAVRKLYREGNIAKIEVDRVEAEVNELEKRINSEMATLEEEYHLAKKAYEETEVMLTQGEIKAPYKGIILSVYANLGESIIEQSQLLRIGTAESHLKGQVNEEDVGQLKVGMKAVVKLYSYQGKKFSAQVKEILPQGDNQKYGVLLSLENPPETLLPGMTGELLIIVGESENTLIIPTRAILSNRSYNRVLIVDDGKVRMKEVKIGFRNIEKVQILSGLEEGEMVVLSNHDLYQPGDRVEPVISE